MSWQTVLGFEVHVELGTNTKMFCACPADHFGKPANTQVCPVCLGLPGALPVPNKQAIEWTIRMGLALGCQINLLSKFDRKNYFYPDIPKGYQISQYDLPFCYGGKVVLASGKEIRITRVHLEEDTGKLQHMGDETLIDFNRSSVPLVEIVTEPDFDNAEDGVEFLKEIQQIIRTLGISTADMEKGSMRLEANISVKISNSPNLPNYKVEVKNVNSFRFIKKAIEFETARQIKILEEGKTPPQETRGFSESKGETVSQRSKEEANDYRYFPEPDIPPLEFTAEQIAKWRSELPKLPVHHRTELISKGLSDKQAAIIVSSPKRLAKFAELTIQNDPKIAADAVINISEDKLDNLKIEKKEMITDEAIIKPVAEKVIAANPKAVADYKAGKVQILGFLVGQIKKDLNMVDVTSAQSILQRMLQ